MCLCVYRTRRKKSAEVRITQTIGEEKGNSYRKNEEFSGRKTHTNTRKLS